MSRSLSQVRARTTRAIASAELPECWVQSTYASAANAYERTTKSARVARRRLNGQGLEAARSGVPLMSATVPATAADLRADYVGLRAPRVPVIHYEICTPERFRPGHGWEGGEAIGSCRVDEDPQDIADQFFPNEYAVAVEGTGGAHVASIQVGDQDDEGCPRAVTVAEIWEVR